MNLLKYNTFTFVMLSAILILCSACKTININGQFVDDKAIEEMKGKKLTKDQVIELIGSPTVIPDYSPRNWYYVQRTISRRAWFEPKILEQKIIEVSFDASNLVTNVKTLDNTHIEQITAVNEYTKTNGTDANGIQKFVRNIGRFNKPNDKKKSKK